MTVLAREHFEALAAAAVAAPSADNRHVFRLAPQEGGLRLLPTEDFLRAPSSRRTLGLISLGAVAQNMELRGRALGLRLDVRWRFAAPGAEVLADVDCQPADAVADRPADPLERAIEARHSNRRIRFTGPNLSADAQAQLSAEAGAVPETGLAWLDEPARRAAALRLIRLAETERFRNEELHHELFSSIRFDVGWHASAPEGLPAGSLELPWFERPAFSMLRHWSVQRAANVLGVHRFIGLRAADLPCRLAPHLCAVTAQGDPDAAAIAAGRLLQRVWLRATAQGLSLQVFAASPLYSLEGATAIDAGLRARLADGWKALCDGRRPFVVLRMGHAAPPTVRAGRPGRLSDFFTV